MCSPAMQCDEETAALEKEKGALEAQLHTMMQQKKMHDDVRGRLHVKLKKTENEVNRCAASDHEARSWPVREPCM
jgi:hypothetical protein